MSCPLILIREKIRKKILLEITYDFNEDFFKGTVFIPFYIQTMII